MLRDLMPRHAFTAPRERRRHGYNMRCYAAQVTAAPRALLMFDAVSLQRHGATLLRAVTPFTIVTILRVANADAISLIRDAATRYASRRMLRRGA